MKPLLIAATLALSIAAVSWSSPASAETFFAEGVWNADRNQFEFYDSRLVGNDFSAPYFASMTKSYDNFYGREWNLVTNIPSYNSNIERSEIHKIAVFSVITSRYLIYDRSEYHNDTLIQSEHFKHVATTPIQVDCFYSPSHGYFCPPPSSDFSYEKRTADGEIFESKLPFDLGALEASALTLPDGGILDFDQSFIYFNDKNYPFEHNQVSLTELFVAMRDSLHKTDEGNTYIWSFSPVCTPATCAPNIEYMRNSTTNNFSLSFEVASVLGHGMEITGITLAYNLPVPEPETWAMLLAGLGIVGAVSRRQRARAAM